MTDADESVWRDEAKLPVSELSRAMASWDLDGQGDPTGNDAGAEEAFGHDSQVPLEVEPDATDPYRESRPSTTGRTGPDET
jgi:hypothetical protein